MKNIYEREGIEGLIEALEYGRSDKDFHQLIENKLEVSRSRFDRYIKKEMKNYTEH